MRLALFALTLLLLPLVFHTPKVAAATPDFTLSAFYTYSTGAPSNVVIVTGQNGFSGVVTLVLSTPAGFTASLTPSTATLDQTTTSVNLSLVANGNPTGNYVVNITATSGSLSHVLQIKYNIVPQTSPNIIVDSNLGLTGGWDILRGSSSTSTIHVSSNNGFAGTVSLQATSFPSGPTDSFENPTVNVQPGQPGITALTLSAPATIPPGVYTVVLTGTSGTVTQVAFLDVIVTYGFELKANPITLTLPQGGQTNSIITLSSLGRWTGTTGLTASCASLTCNLNPPSLQLSDPASTAQSTLAVSAGSTLLPGSYTVNVAETSSVPATSFNAGIDLTVIVTGPDFTISASPGALTFTPGVADALPTTVTLSSIQGFSGYINTTVSVSPSVGPPLPDPPSASPKSLNRALVTPSGPTSFTITVSIDTMVMQGPYIVQISAITMMPGGLLSHSFYAVATVGPDFHMSASPANLIVHQGTLALSTITFTSLNGFAGGVAMEAAPLSVLPPNPRTNFFPSYPTISPGGTNSTEFMVMADQSTGLGIYNVWLSASTGVQVGFGWIGHAIPMTITVEGPVTGPDFALSSQPSHVDLSIGASTTSTVTASSINGFNGVLTLQTDSYAVFGALSPTTVVIGPTVSASSTLTINAPTPYQIDGYPLWYPASGERSLLVIASNSTGFAHWVWVNQTVAPIRVTTNPSQLDIPPGSSANSQIDVSGLDGFNLTVALSAIISPSGPTTSLTNGFINFSASPDPASVGLNVNMPSTAPMGVDYVVRVTATSMSHQWFCQCNYYNITYTTLINVRAVAPSSNQGPPPGSGPSQGPGPNPSSQPSGSAAGIFGIQPTEFYGVISAAAIALVVSAGYLGFRRRKSVI